MDKKVITILSIIISIVLVGSIVFVYFGKNNNIDPISIDSKNDFVFLNNISLESNVHSYLFKDYDEFENMTHVTNTLNKSDFDNNNYFMFRVTYDECAEKDLKLTNYYIKDNYVNIKASYTMVCDNCEYKSNYYVIPVDKKYNNLSYNIDYTVLNDINCYYGEMEKKPIIYLYPLKEMDIEVKLSNSDNIFVSYPKYNNGWKVKAYPGSKIILDNREYYGLYYESKNHKVNVKEDGFVIEGKDTTKFLEEKLSLLGLNDREINEFIIYWLPQMEKNKYNYIRFETNDEINNYMKLDINPKPDTLIRIIMDFKPLNYKIDVKEQELKPIKRKGYTVIEWGGSIIN